MKVEYTRSMKHKGFTVVELIVVIVVIAILAAISLVSYAFVTEDAQDAKIRSIVQTAGEAIALHESNNNGARISGQQYFGNSGGVDSLVPAYLHSDYREGVSSKNVSAPQYIFRWYPCNNSGGGFVIYASLNNPSPDDVSKFGNTRTSCGHTDTEAPTSGPVIYNYAKTF